MLLKFRGKHMRKETKELFKSYGIDVNKALKTLKNTPISIQCWQLDDVQGFENADALSGGIQSTGNYPGKARNFDEWKSDMDVALKLIPGTKRINVHASYQTNNVVDRSLAGPEQYKDWVKYAKERGLGLDFNPTIFSSSHMNDGLSLSSPDKETRDYWIRHCINSIKVSEYFATELGSSSLCNIWIPDGLKEQPADRMGPRERLKDALDQILACGYDKKKVDVAVESKVFGIGIESYTVGSNEFYIQYAMKNNIIYLLDMGHFHPTEVVADKISSWLLFNKKIAFHVSRPVRWDSDHVIKLNDDLQEVADELVRLDALKRARIGLDFFDGSINRIAAIVIGTRNMEKALLKALLTPWNLLKEAQDNQDHTRVLELQEEIKTLPWQEVWNEYLKQEGVPSEKDWLPIVKEYETKVQLKRK